jgi:hypothetical protein
MENIMRRHAPLLALLLLLLTSPVVTAQRDIDRGTVNFTSSFLPVGQFRFEGPQLALTGGLQDGLFTPECGPCTGGQPISIRSVYEGEGSYQRGTLTTSGATSDVYFDGSLHFDGPMLTLPIRYSRLPFRITVPMTVQGILRVHKSSPISQSTLMFVIPVNLIGNATVTFRTMSIDSFGRPIYQRIGTTYEFPLAAKTEEN